MRLNKINPYQVKNRTASREIVRFNQSGLFLIEMMISIILSMTLIYFILDIYQTAVKTADFQADLRALQANSNLASAILHFEIHRAGYMGYARLSNGFPVVDYFPYSLTIHNRIIGQEKEIIIRKMEETNSTLLKDTRDGVSVVLSNEYVFSPNDILMIADYWHSEIFKVKQIINKSNYQIIFPTKPLKQRFQKQAEIGKFTISKLFISKTKRKNNRGESIYALYKSILKENNTFSRKSELVEGVYDIHFQYSVMRKNRLYDLSVKEISDWSQVVGVTIKLEMNQSHLYKTRYLYVALES